MFDLNTLAVKETLVVELRNPSTDEVLVDDKGNKLSITMYSQGSKEYRSALNKLLNISLKRGKKTPSAESFRGEQTDLLEALTVSVENITVDKEVITKDNVRILYTDPKYFWIREQVDAATQDISLSLGK